MMGSVAARFLEFQDKYINAFPYEAGQPPEDCQCRTELREPSFPALSENEEAG